MAPQEEVAQAHPARAPSLIALVREWPWAPWLLGALAVARLVAVAGLRPYLYVDSGEYDTLDLSGGSRRPWATPLLYRLVPGDERRLVVAQALVAVVCWGLLALSAAAWCRHSRVRAALSAAVVVLACTTSVTNWDAAKLSESLALSLTAALVAVWLELVRRPGVGAAVAVLALTLPWLFVRQSLLSVAWLVVLAAATGAVVTWRRGGAPRLLAAVAVGLAVLASTASWSYGRNQEIVRENLTVIVANRVAPDGERLAWFTDHGMPVPATGALDAGSLGADPAFTSWVARDGRSTYVRYLLTHPWYTLTEPLEDFAQVRRTWTDPPEPLSQPSMLAPIDTYAAVRPVLPDAVESVLFRPGDTGAVLFALIGLGAWTAARRRQRRAAWVVPLTLVVLSFASLYTGWHGATPELGRLALVGAVSLRVALLLQLAFLVEGELLARGDREPAPA